MAPATTQKWAYVSAVGNVTQAPQENCVLRLSGADFEDPFASLPSPVLEFGALTVGLQEQKVEAYSKLRSHSGGHCVYRSFQVARVAIATIATDRERFVGGVHSPMASVKKCNNTVANYYWKAGFVTVELVETGEDGDEERIDDAFRKLSSLFPAAVPPEVAVDDFVEVDCNVRAVASLADEDICHNVARVAIAAIATDRKRFVGGVHSPMASVKKRNNTVANYFWKAGFVTAELAETGEDGDEERIADAFGKLSSLFPAAVPPEVSADDFVEVNCNVQAVASLADEDIVAAVAGTQDAQADSSSGDEDRPDEAAATHAYSAAEVAAAFGLICCCCGDMEGTGLSHLNSLDKIEASVFNFISKTEKQAKISDFFSRK
ncbi:hypothetical protein HPB52_007199 [Rhipicephalus sanguineus]|uniref:Uncharacterized protein n=1 Tax=Rhipicephalus sanguineus TaxID=34632 RepID=A0A9D4QI25_RHISA|nr:hypothetical protein HPB52_007199 [Rhipicephalus sanguineus]